MKVMSLIVKSWTHCYGEQFCFLYRLIFRSFSSGKCTRCYSSKSYDGYSIHACKGRPVVKSFSPISRFVFRPLLTEDVLGYLTQVITGFKEDFVIYEIVTDESKKIVHKPRTS